MKTVEAHLQVLKSLAMPRLTSQEKEEVALILANFKAGEWGYTSAYVLISKYYGTDEAEKMIDEVIKEREND